MTLRKLLARVALVSAFAGYTAFVALPVGVAWAQHDNHGHDDHGHPPAHGADPLPGKTKGAHDEHGGDAHGGDAHGGGHHGPGQINWLYGLIGEKDGLKEPDLLFRPKGMPAPFLANIINFGVVLFILVSKAGPVVSKSLLDRRDDLQKGIESAAKAKAEAQTRFDEQQGRLDRMDEEISRIRADYAEQGKHDLERIEREGKERHERFVREAQLLIEQEGRALRQRMLQETVEAVTTSAAEALQKQIGTSDHERLANEYLGQLGALSMKRGEA